MFRIYLFFIISNIFIFSKNEKLIFAEIHFRHGARAPSTLNDNGEDALGIKWNTPGELTSVGKRMQYLLGLRNRDRYITGKYKFISEVYDPHELIVYSSNVNRTLESISAQIQGFYPFATGKNETLSNGQIERGVPPFNLSEVDEIEKEKNNLKESALPNYMTIIPIHYISFRNSSINCTEKVRSIIINNFNKSSVVDFVDDFNKNYSEIFNNYLNKEKDNVFNFSFVVNLCDSVYADHYERKNTSSFFEKTGIDKDLLMQSCKDALTINYRDIYYGDDNNEYILLQNSYLLGQMINYMKRRVDDDINGDISKKNISDYSRPKMVFISGHDTTLSGQEMYFIRFFNLKLDSYILPIYASQISFEIMREDIEEDKRNTLQYSDYVVYYYFNDKPILNVTFDKFLETIEKNIWDLETMEFFCSGQEKVDTTIIIIFLGVLIVTLSLIVIILTVILLKRKKVSNEDYKSKIDNLSNEKLINEDEKD